jgi:hypothetical protein
VEHENGPLYHGRNCWIPPRAASISCSATVAAATNLKYVCRARLFAAGNAPIVLSRSVWFPRDCSLSPQPCFPIAWPETLVSNMLLSCINTARGHFVK